MEQNISVNVSFSLLINQYCSEYEWIIVIEFQYCWLTHTQNFMKVIMRRKKTIRCLCRLLWFGHVVRMEQNVSVTVSYSLQPVLINQYCSEYEWIRVVEFQYYWLTHTQNFMKVIMSRKKRFAADLDCSGSAMLFGWKIMFRWDGYLMSGLVKVSIEDDLVSVERKKEPNRRRQLVWPTSESLLEAGVPGRMC